MGRRSNYENELHSVHSAMLSKLKNETHKRNAQELQSILQEIKITARHIKDGSPPNDFISQELYNQYVNLIEESVNLQNQFHAGNFSTHTLFGRQHRYDQTFTTGADDIFEEDFAAVLAAIGSKTNNKNLGIIENYLVGSKMATSRSVDYIKRGLTEYTEEQALKMINDIAEKEGSKKRVKEIKTSVHKTDIIGYPSTVEFVLDVHPRIARLAELMKEATFSAKNYKSESYQDGKTTIKDFEEINLHLGNSNLFRAVTGALSEIKMSEVAKIKFFFEGAGIYLTNKYGIADEVEKHFGDLRFIYELRGSGLMTGNGLILPVKYLIYNDPDSEAIFVRDTASIILESFEKSRNLFGSIHISASRIRS